MAVSEANTGTWANPFSSSWEEMCALADTVKHSRDYMLNMHITCTWTAFVIIQALILPVFMHCLTSACESFLRTEGL